MEGYDDTTYGERWADVYDEWYAEGLDTDETVAFLAALAGDPATAGVLVELGVGTGRLALPLAARGYDVRGIDASPAMVAHLRQKPGGADLPVTIGDMADVRVPGGATGAELAGDGTCRGVFVAYNTLFNLVTFDAQRRCVARVAEVLEVGGWFVCAGFVPDLTAPPSARGDVGVRSMTADHVVLTANVHDPAAQTVSGQFIDIRTDGIRLRPFHLRYLLPRQLDEVCVEHGLVLETRHADWSGTPFDDAGSPGHVSVYRRAAASTPTW